MFGSMTGRSVITDSSLKALLTVLWLIYSTDGRFVGKNGSLRSDKPGTSEAHGTTDVRISRDSYNSDGKSGTGGSTGLSELEWSAYSYREPNGPGTFAFGYDNAIDSLGNEHYRTEERYENGTVVGEYGYTDYGINRIVHVTYTADSRGYRAKTELLRLPGSSMKNRILG